MLIRLLLLCTCVAAAVRAGAQADEPLFYRISLEQGLSDARITSIVQDKYGFMWFGTSAGLNRYDGYNIKVYEEGESGLNSNNISTLYCSRAGRLYVSDADGLLEYDYAADRFKRPYGTDSLPLNKDSYNVTLMAEDAEGRIYLGCAREGFHRYNPRTGGVENLNKLLNAPRIKHVSGLTFGKDGRLWVTTQKQGFFGIDFSRNTWKEIPQPKYRGMVDTCCAAVHRTVFIDDENLLMGQHSMGLIVFNTRTEQFTPHIGILGRNDSVRFNAVLRLIKDYKGRIWAGTAYFGLVQHVPSTGQNIQYKYDPYNPYSYGGYRVSALYEDRDHNIWVGTGGYGIYRFHPDKITLRHYPWYPMGATNTPPGPEVLSSALHDLSSVWIGTDRGPALFNFRQGTFKSYPYTSSYNPTKPGNNLIVVYPDSRGLVWMSSRFLGLTRYDPCTNSFRRFRRMGDAPFNTYGKHLRGDIPGNSVLNIVEDPDGNLLLLIERRIAIFDPRTTVCRSHYSDTTHPLLRLKGLTDFIGAPGSLVYSTDSGGVARVWRYDYANNRTLLLATLEGDAKATLNKLYLLSDGPIAAATSKGIFIVGKEGGIKRHFVWAGPGRRQRIVALAPAADQMLWVCTDRHVGVLDMKSGRWYWLGPSEGLKPTRFFGNAFRLLPDGRLLVGSGDGLFLVNTQNIQPLNGRTRPPMLVDFKVSGKVLSLPTPLQDVREIGLSHEQNFFSFGMSTLSFGESSNTEYSYKLEGFDREWQTAGPDRTGQYTGVWGGDYTLLLRARSGTDSWVVSPQKVRIIVGKPWWATWPFRILVALLLAGIVAIIYANRVRSIRKAARLRSEYEIRLNELEMSALRTQMNPHFIFNCLNTINSYINSNQKSEANHYITRFARLIRLILENSRKRRVDLTSELEALDLYLQLERLRFEARFTYSIVVPDSLDTDNVEVPPLVLQPFVENAILHGVLPADREGRIAVRVERDGQVLRFYVEDNGIGRAEAIRRRAGGALKKESHGMDITLKRIAFFNREEGLEAEVQIEDLEKGSPQPGTRVIIPLALAEGF